MNFVIATSNTNKIERLKKVLVKIDFKVTLDDLVDKNVEVVPEISNSQIINLKTKLKYYHSLLNTNVICEDDAFEFLTTRGLIIVIKVNDFFKKKKDIFQQWKNFFDKNNVKRGKLIKYFGVVINGKTKIQKIEIPLVVKHDRVKNISEKNILNNFLGPFSEKKTFNEMSSEEKDIYFEKKYISVLKKLIK